MDVAYAQFEGIVIYFTAFSWCSIKFLSFWWCTSLSTWWNLRFRDMMGPHNSRPFTVWGKRGGNMGAHFFEEGSCCNGVTLRSRWVQLPYWNRVFFTAVFTTTVSRIILRTETKKSTFSHIMNFKCKYKDLIYPSSNFDKETNSLKIDHRAALFYCNHYWSLQSQSLDMYVYALIEITYQKLVLMVSCMRFASSSCLDKVYHISWTGLVFVLSLWLHTHTDHLFQWSITLHT